MGLPNFVPGNKVEEYKAEMLTKGGTVNYVPISPSPVKKEKEAEKKQPVKK